MILAPLLLALLPAAPQETDALAPGSKAPPLAVETWLRGEPVKAFEQGKVYVLEFWATWSEPSIASMPHVARLARQYAARDVVVIGVTSGDSQGNTLTSARALVEEKAAVMDHRVAWDDGRKTSDAYLRAAGQGSLPCAFVVDREGRVAYVGHPMFLDEVLAGVLDGSWRAATDAPRLVQDGRRFVALYGKVRFDPQGALEDLGAFEKAHPRLLALTEPLRLQVEIAAGKHEAAVATGERLLERAGAEGDSATLVAAAVTALEASGFSGGPDLALHLARRAVELTGSRDTSALAALARAHGARGEVDLAEEILANALTIAAPRDRGALMRALDEVRARAGRGAKD